MVRVSARAEFLADQGLGCDREGVQGEGEEREDGHGQLVRGKVDGTLGGDHHHRGENRYP
jgi:hypothetical protein